MTQDEVDLIYDYLHENYEYKGGDLISKIECGQRHTYKGHKPGCLKKESETNIQIYMRVTVNKKSYDHPSAFFIYLYHFKIWPERIQFKDNNGLNTEIDNLILSTKKEMEHEKAIHKKGYYKKILKNGEIRYFSLLRTSIGFIYLGSYESEKDAFQIHKYARNKYIKCKTEQDVILLKSALSAEMSHKNTLKNKGYSWNKNKYAVKIYHKKTYYQIGRYDTEEEARAAYLDAKIKLKNDTFILNKKPRNPLGRGVSRSHNKYKACIRMGGEPIYLGSFDTPMEAQEAYQRAKKDYENTTTIPTTSR